MLKKVIGRWMIQTFKVESEMMTSWETVERMRVTWET